MARERVEAIRTRRPRSSRTGRSHSSTIDGWFAYGSDPFMNDFEPFVNAVESYENGSNPFMNGSDPYAKDIFVLFVASFTVS
jgi:hypothetical protein